MENQRRQQLYDALASRILIIDGAMGGMFMEALVDSLERIDVEMKI